MKRTLVSLVLPAALVLSACITIQAPGGGGNTPSSGGASNQPGPASDGIPSADGRSVTFVDNMGVTIQELTRTFNLPSDDVVYYWRINIAFAPPGVTERMLDTEFQGNIPRGVFIGGYLLNPDGALPTNNLDWRYYTNYAHPGDVRPRSGASTPQPYQLRAPGRRPVLQADQSHRKHDYP